jgi:hypothetical protein
MARLLRATIGLHGIIFARITNTMMNMVQILRYFFLPLAFMTTASYAQPGHEIGHGPVTPVRVGTMLFNAGIGAGSGYEGDYYNPAFGIKGAVEWGLWQAGPGVITLGGEAGGSFSNGGYNSNGTNDNHYRSSTIIIAARAAWHFGWQVPGLDTYGGFSAGLGFHHFEYDQPAAFSHNTVIPVPGIFVGASYFVTPTFGFNAEAGHDITDIQIGVVFKIK